MGIQSFLKRVQDAGFGSSPTEISRRGALSQKAILDGPNLAFHVARLLLEKERSADATIWPSITYARIVDSLMDFLQMLERNGFEIYAIYFDGVLPPTKRDVRISRLQRYADALSSYHTLHYEASKIAHKGAMDTSKLWSSSSLERARKALPGLPFLVPAVVEGLLRSTYAGVTYVVPGEADAFCVAAARKACQAEALEKVVIFSNDSDLLIYDCGSQTRIAMFSGLSTTNSSSGSEKLTGTEFWPAAIARMAGKEDLIEVAYHMKKDNTVAVNWVLQLMDQGDYTTDEDFGVFYQTYQIRGEMADLETLQSDTEARLSLVSLDARVSELVHQVKLFPGNKSVPQNVDVFLPFLLEDPTKKSAWWIGRRTRFAAYDLLRSACSPSLAVLHEYKRSGPKISAHVVTQSEMNHDDTELWLSQMVSRFHDNENILGLAELSEIQKWRFTVVHLALLDMIHEEMTVPSAQDVVAILESRPAEQWSLFHLFAQSGDTSLLLPHPRSQLGRDAKSVAQLGEFEDFPGISEFFEPESTSGVTWVSLMEPFLQGLDPKASSKNSIRIPPNKKDKKRKKKSGDNEDVGKKWKRQVSSNNPFAALADMSSKRPQ
nr:hypothetical protein CFP56_10324 [Quercus suber]